MKLLAIIRSLIECVLFPLADSDSYLGKLKEGAVPPALRSAFNKEGVALSDASRIVSKGGGRWSIEGGGDSYMIRARDGALVVSRVQRPVLARLGYGALQASVRAGQTYRMARDALFLVGASLQKRFFENPTERMINIGAGRWHQPGWKVLDYAGDWYAYPKVFVDFHYDLTSRRPMPFDEGSVDLFYSEHTFEHVRDEHCEYAFGELHRALRVGGGLRIVVPDADLIYERFRARDQGFFRDWMIRDSASLGEAFLILVAHPRASFDEGQLWKDILELPKTELLQRYAGPLRYDYSKAGEHINWFTYEKLHDMLARAGFSEVRRSGPQQSRFEQIRGPGFDTRPSYSLHVDAVK